LKSLQWREQVVSFISSSPIFNSIIKILPFLETIILGSSSSPESLMKAALQVTPKKERAGILEKLLENEALSDEENLLDDLMRNFC
jgi:hypothetical protein